jgi:hypothetical protein
LGKLNRRQKECSGNGNGSDVFKCLSHVLSPTFCNTVGRKCFDLGLNP